MKWECLRSDEFEGAIERSKGLCVIPLGCLEKHGPHLPVGTDSIYATVITEEAADLEEACVFPAGMWLGDVMAFHPETDPIGNHKAGFICINPHTLLTILEELCDEIARNGFRKILFVNSHGGNSALLNYFFSAQAYKKKNYATMCTSVLDTINPASMYRIVKERREEFLYLTEADMEAMERMAELQGNGLDHAGWLETALMYACTPELVCAERMDMEESITNQRSNYLKAKNIGFTHSWFANFPNHYAGYTPVGCSENIGKALRCLCVERLAEKFKLLKDDEDCVRMTQGLPKL